VVVPSLDDPAIVEGLARDALAVGPVDILTLPAPPIRVDGGATGCIV